MRYCPKCGFKLAADYKVCPQCGYHLSSQKSSHVSEDTIKVQSHHLSRTQAHAQRPPHNSILQYLLWLKNNLITTILVIVFIILTYIYVGKIISLIVAVGMLIWGYVFANRHATAVDTKLKGLFKRVEEQPTTKVAVHSTYTQAVRPKVLQRPSVQTRPVALAQHKSRRSWGLVILAIITWSTSYWPGFFANNLLGTAIGWNSPTIPSLAQMSRQALMYLNFNYHLQINPALGSWLFALGPLLVLLGALMPRNLGRKLALKGALLSAVIDLGGLAILKIGLDWGSRYVQLPPFALGSSGYAAVLCVILMLILALINRYRFRD
ncbi:zinc-ribbon domain-containing protein [Bombilactobacillus bombi]|uniref:zinc-ribbon domain-containing protein n=1 Tax=Bombilactobacillus bombi TaxID=1303590 RepID=UPI0015E5DB58|nr:zinc-ribbon domain-containing protein [Bombilactobacillus bombi]MBA1434499.1 zinc ribbon domain-containing protein [Bombilactobacillus bombi]